MLSVSEAAWCDEYLRGRMVCWAPPRLHGVHSVEVVIVCVCDPQLSYCTFLIICTVRLSWPDFRYSCVHG